MAVVVSQPDPADGGFKQYLLAGLLQRNYFPNQKKYGDEVPPILSSALLTPEVALRVQALNVPKRSNEGYGAVVYKSTRFNGVVRSLSLPHPKPYVMLVSQLVDNWGRLQYIRGNSQSLILPQRHKDGRVIIMDYEETEQDVLMYNKAAFGKRYLVNTDVSDCFNSIYTHAIPWALIGKQKARGNMNKKSAWYNKLDRAIRNMNRRQSKGLLIGPSTSTILAETILYCVDKSLERKGYVFYRHIDDYKAYCDNQEQAEQFVLDLAIELDRFILRVNESKTKIQELPKPVDEDWLVDLRQALSTVGSSARQMAAFLDLALRLSKDSPDSSVLKWALRAAVNKCCDERPDVMKANVVLSYAFNWAYRNAVLVPVMDRLLSTARKLGSQLVNQANLEKLLRIHLELRHFDAVSWLLYFSIKCGIIIPDNCVDPIITSRDCIAILLLYEAGTTKHKQRVVSFCKSIKGDDLYELDQYWLLLYQMWLYGKIKNPYPKDDNTFEVLKDGGVNFVTDVPPGNS